MKKSLIELNASKEKQGALTYSVKERFQSIETGMESLRHQTILNAVQIKSIRNELVGFETRIRNLETLKQTLNTQVVFESNPSR